MKPIFVNNTWCIEVESDEFGSVLLIDDNSTSIMPLSFKNKEDACTYIENLALNTY